MFRIFALGRLSIGALLLALAAKPALALDEIDVLGHWCLHRWAEPEFPGKTYTGHLIVERNDEGGGLVGEMLIRADDDESFARQAMLYEIHGEYLIGYGTILEARFWSPDVVRLRLHNGLLEGGGFDVNQETFTTSFRPGACQEVTS